LAGGAVEEGDNRFRPTAGIEFVAPSGLLGTIMAFGRQFGTVTEQTVILSGGQPLDLFGGKTLQGIVGISVLSETTTIKATTAADTPSNTTDAGQKDQSTNIGGLFGIRGQIYSIKGVTFAGSWESHVYPPGISVIALSTGRKQLLTLNVGVSL